MISTTNTFKLFDIKETGSQVVANFERKDVWDMKWDSDKEDTIAIMEKSRLHVIQGTIAEDPVTNHGYICSFKDLIVRTVEIQTLMQDPKEFEMGLITDIEVKVGFRTTNLVERSTKNIKLKIYFKKLLINYIFNINSNSSF